jgi:hypothetical protein
MMSRDYHFFGGPLILAPVNFANNALYKTNYRSMLSSCFLHAKTGPTAHLGTSKQLSLTLLISIAVMACSLSMS